MAVKPLSLKRQRPNQIPKAGRSEYVAEVIVYDLAFHLPETFSYGVPKGLEDRVKPGSFVQIPFRNNVHDGLIVSIKRNDDAPLKPILKVSDLGISSEMISFSRAVAERYICRTSDILKNIQLSKYFNDSEIRRERESISLHIGGHELIIEHLQNVGRDGSLLIILPTRRELESVERELLSRNIPVALLLKATSKRSEIGIYLGLRSSVLTQLPSLKAIWVVDEGSEHYWERRAPYWNVRDLVLLRSQFQKFQLKFICVSPSLELYRLGELGYVKEVSNRSSKTKRQKVRFNDETYHQIIRDGLKSGPVLVCVAAKEYARSLACSKCGTVPRCECGGKLHLKSAQLPICSLCGASSDWRCPDCSNSKYVLLSKGASRIGEEFRKAFPNIRIFVSTLEKPVDHISGKAIVIATAGMEPDGVFSSAVFMDAQYLQNLPELRSEEKLRRYVFSILSKLKESTPIYLDLSPMNRLSRAVTMGNASLGLNEELNERRQAKLPPFWRIFRIQADSISRILNNLSKDINEVEIFYENDRTAILRVAVDKGALLAESLYLLQKYRSISRKPLMAIEVDPFNL